MPGGLAAQAEDVRKLARWAARALGLGAALALAMGGAAGATTRLGPPPPAGGIGVYPAVVAFSSALRGGEYVETIGVLNGSARGQWFHLQLTGAAAAWLRVAPSTGGNRGVTQLWAPGGGRATAELELRVPSAAANGTYPAGIEVFTLPSKATAKRPVTVGLGATLRVSVDVVGTEVIAGELVNAYTYPKIEVGEPLRVFAVVKNSSNVTVQPRLQLVVTKGARHARVYSLAKTGTNGALPNWTATYELDWPASSTLGATLGAYTAELTVTFPHGKRVGSWQLPFRLYPYGSLHRGGRLLSLKLANHPRAGGQAVVDAAVLSTGEVQQETYFIGQLYRDGSFVRALKSPVPVLLAPKGQPGDSGTLVVPVAVAGNGLYRVTGVANFAGAQSQPLTLSFRVGPAPLPLAWEVALGAGAVVLVVLLVALALGFRRRRRPPAGRSNSHVAPRYTASHPLTVHVPPRAPAASSPGRPHPRARRG